MFLPSSKEFLSYEPLIRMLKSLGKTNIHNKWKPAINKSEVQRYIQHFQRSQNKE